MFPLDASLLGLLLLRSPLVDIRLHESHAGTEGPKLARTFAYLDIIINGEIVPIHAGQRERVPLPAVGDMLAVCERFPILSELSAVVDTVLEREPGNMILLDMELDLKLPYPQSGVGMDRSHVLRLPYRERLIEHDSGIHTDFIVVGYGSLVVSLIPGDVDTSEIPIS